MLAKIISIGEVLFDVFDETELLAGAPLNVSAHLHRLGHEVAFVSGIGNDDAGDRALLGVEDLGLPTKWLVRRSEPTGRVNVEISGGEPSYKISRGVAYEHISLLDDVRSSLLDTKADWIYFGTLAQCSPITRATTEALYEALPTAKRFYDLNLRSGFDASDLIVTLLQRADVAKLNHLELRRISSLCGWEQQSEDEILSRLASTFDLEAVCVTRGECGAGLLHRGCYFEAIPPRIEVVDTVGAGDAFAAALLHGLSEGWTAERIITFGNALGSLVASSRGAIPSMTTEQLTTLMNYDDDGGDECGLQSGKLVLRRVLEACSLGSIPLSLRVLQMRLPTSSI